MPIRILRTRGRMEVDDGINPVLGTLSTTNLSNQSPRRVRFPSGGNANEMCGD